MSYGQEIEKPDECEECGGSLDGTNLGNCTPEGQWLCDECITEYWEEEYQED